MALKRTLSTITVLAACHRPDGGIPPQKIESRALEKAPPAALPTCGGEEWAAMGRALSAACKPPRADVGEARDCRATMDAWHACALDVRKASSIRDHWKDEVLVMVLGEGEWHGIVFGKQKDGWKVVGFDGGDIP